jgi:Xaa-Pro aminopeptidase
MSASSAPMATPAWADFPTEEYEARVASAQRAMRQAGLDVLMLAERENVEYFSGFRCGHWISKTFATAIVLLHVTKDPVLVIPDFFAGTAKGSSWIAQHAYFSEPHARPRGVAPVVVEAVQALAGPAPVIGLESGENLVAGWNLADYEAVRAGLASATFTSGGEVLWACRMRKSAREIDRLRTVTRITERAMVETREQLHAGMTETEIAAAVATAGYRHGADGVLFTNIRAGLDRYPCADSEPVDRPVAKGEMLVYDVGLTLGGYVTDIAYSTVIGPPTAKHHEVWRHIVKAQDAGLAAMRPGVRARDVFGACHQVLADYGFGTIIDMVGHGIGFDVHEPPIIAPYDDHVLEPGMVFALEPWIYDIEGIGIFALEEIVAITEDGHELLSEVPRDELWSTVE